MFSSPHPSTPVCNVGILSSCNNFYRTVIIIIIIIICRSGNIGEKLNFVLEQAWNTQTGRKSVALLFL